VPIPVARWCNLPDKLGILAGGGTLPRRLIESCQAIGRDIYVLGFEDQTDPAILSDVPHDWTRVGAADKTITLLRAAGVKNLVMVGRVRRPSLAELQLDWRAARLMAKVGLRALGDDGLLKAVKLELEAEGFRLLGIDEVLEGLIATPGTYGKLLPDARAEADIEHGFRVVATLGALDIGQAAIVQHGLVLGVEAIDGTEALIRRCGALKREGAGGVLVKAAKPKQERRIDLPAIGVGTIEQAAEAGLRGIAVEAGNTLVIDREAVIEAADRLGLFVVGRRPTADAPLFYLVAGEPSGDVIGARLMRALREKTDGAVRFAGIGGERMAEEGLESLLPIRGLAIMGLLEVVPAARRIFRWVKQTAAEIERLRPVAVITIDSSGFCFRLAKQLRRKANPPLIIHYVAPMVWAWRPNRVHHAKRAADHLLALLPFEPPYFEAVGLPTTYIGHPVVESERGRGDLFRIRHGIAADATILAVLPGSRIGEVRKLLPVFKAAVSLLTERHAHLVTIIPTVENVADEVRATAAGWPGQLIVVQGAADKQDGFAAATAALAASGTVSLELAMAGVPSVIGYRITRLTHWFLSRSTPLKWATLINILLDREAVPELLQDRCTPEALAAELDRLLSDPAKRQSQIEAFEQALQQIGLGGTPPSLKAADKILELVSSPP